MVASFSLAIEKIPHKQQIVHICFFFRKFTNTSNIFVVPLFWKLFRMIQQKIQNNATNLSLIQGQNSCR